MGMREWHWGSGRSSSDSKTRGRATQSDITTKTSSASTGCMCAVFQLFDFQQLQLANLNHHHQQQQQQQEPSFRPHDDLSPPKGVEAPRNSLDSSERTSLSSITTEEDHFNSPILKFQMGMQIKTSARSSSADFSSDMVNSPGTKTPNLVARLMGLELLPDQPNSPSSTTSSSTISKTKAQLQSRRRRRSPRPHAFDDSTANGTRSLPDTPRISLARKSDVDHHHHRLSLQINKENIGVREDLDSSYKRRDLKMIHFGDNENGRSPRHYARQIVKQVKESVTRKVGLDITNTNTTRSSAVNKENKQFQSKDKLLQQLKSKNADSSKPSSLASQDQLQVVVPSKPKSSSLPSVKPKPKPKPKPKSGHDIGYGPKLMMTKNKQKEEAFVHVSPSTAPTRAINHINNNRDSSVDKKYNSKKTHLLLSSYNVPTLLPIKKDPSPPATKLPLKQAQRRQQILSDAKAKQLKRRWSSQLSCSTSQAYKQQVTPHFQVLPTRDDIPNFNGDITNGTTTTSTTAAGGVSAHSDPHLHQYEYVTRILTRIGIDKHTQVSFTNWFSPSHPLDPSIFYLLENSTRTSTTSQLGQRCNRKLLFHLVDEILVDILRPYINLKPWVVTGSKSRSVKCINGSQLINMVCYKIQSFPGADCRVLEDIDALIGKDMPESKDQSEMAFQEEGEGIVREVEKDILDTLIHETARVLWI